MSSQSQEGHSLLEAPTNLLSSFALSTAMRGDSLYCSKNGRISTGLNSYSGVFWAKSVISVLAPSSACPPTRRVLPDINKEDSYYNNIAFDYVPRIMPKTYCKVNFYWVLEF